MLYKNRLGNKNMGYTLKHEKVELNESLRKENKKE